MIPQKRKLKAPKLVTQNDIIKKLVTALKPFTWPGLDLTNAACHRGICEVTECRRCGEILVARQALKSAEHFDSVK